MTTTIMPAALLAMAKTDIPLIRGTQLPQIIHQSWKSTILPTLFEEMAKTWRTQYKGFLYVLWTDEDNFRLVKERAPEHLDLYNSFPREIYRVDFARNLYMREFGGIYVDLDYDSYSSLEPYFAEHAGPGSVAFLARAPEGAQSNEGLVKFSLPNSFLASTPGHPFWYNVIARTRYIWYESTEILWNGRRIQTYVEAVTGPDCQYHAWQKHVSGPQAADCKILEIPPELLTPFAWYHIKGEDLSQRMLCMVQAGKAFDLEVARKRYNDGVAYACTYHACTWGMNWLEAEEGEEPKDLRPGGSFEE